MTFLLLIAGFALLTLGGSLLVDGAASIARRYGISDIVIGLTVVAFGTSAPELVVNIVSAIKGTTDIAIGNVLGSNISNILLILGLSALMRQLPVQENTIRVDIPLSLLAALVLFPLGASFLSLPLDGDDPSSLGRIDGIILLFFFALFLRYTFRVARVGAGEGAPARCYGVPLSILMLVAGLAALVGGGKVLVDAAVAIARHLGVTERVIGLTIVAVGTSLPEMATSMVAAYKRNADIAVGNIVGSNIFNILLVLGASAVIRPLPVSNGTVVDLSATVLCSLLLLALVRRAGDQLIGRRDGAVLVACYLGYITYLFTAGN